MENPSNIIPDQLIVLEGDAGLVPKASSEDVGKVLGVLNSSGDVGWVPDQEGMSQVQADWDQTDPSQVSYIANKPDLSVYATTSAMNTALAGKQDTISDLSDIRAGAAKGDTAVQPAALNDYATTAAMNTALAGKQDVINDLSDIRSGASAGATAVQPSALDSYATTSAMNTALAGKQDVINDLSDIRSGASAGATAVQPAALEAYATTSAMNTALAGKQNTISDLDAIRSGAAAGSTAVQPSQLPSSDELVPSATSSDSGKVLTVDSNGDPIWQTPAGGSDVVTANGNFKLGGAVPVKVNYTGSQEYERGSLQLVNTFSDGTYAVAVFEVVGAHRIDFDTYGYATVTINEAMDIAGSGNSDFAISFLQSDSNWYNNGQIYKASFTVTDGKIVAQSLRFGSVSQYDTGSYLGVGVKATNSPYESEKVAAVVQQLANGAVSISDWPSEQILATTIPNIPASTSADANKVLTVDSNGDAQWITPSAGTVYTPGDGVDITNNVISADVDGVTIGIDSTTKKIKSLQTIPTKTSDLQNDSNFVVASSLATVATSGSYSDLSNKPNIPTKTSDLQNDSNFVSSSSLATVATTGSYNDLSNKPVIPPGVTVDQTYNASSTNAQAGVAVAQAIAGVKQVPASTSSDENKVLTVNSSGNPVWENSAVPASKPLVAGANITITENTNDVTISTTGTNYTAGDGIDITNGVVSVDYDTNTLDVVGQTITENVTQQSASGLFLLPSSVAALLSQQSDTQVTVHIPGNTLKDEDFQIFDIGEITCRLTLYATDSPSESSVSIFSTPVEYTIDTDNALFTEQDIVFNLPASVANQWSQNLSSAVAFNICGGRNGATYTDSTLTVIGDLTTSPITFTFVDASATKLAVKKPIPASVQSDSGKVLKVNAAGNAEWGTDGFTTTAGVTDIQVVNALPASPVSTVLYLIPEA